MTRRSLFPFVDTLDMATLDSLISQQNFKGAWELIINEIEEDPECKDEVKELFTFVLTTYW